MGCGNRLGIMMRGGWRVPLFHAHSDPANWFLPAVPKEDGAQRNGEHAKHPHDQRDAKKLFHSADSMAEGIQTG
jgi:hypothetical protein